MRHGASLLEVVVIAAISLALALPLALLSSALNARPGYGTSRGSVMRYSPSSTWRTRTAGSVPMGSASWSLSRDELRTQLRLD